MIDSQLRNILTRTPSYAIYVVISLNLYVGTVENGRVGKAEPARTRVKIDLRRGRQSHLTEPW